MHEEINTLTEKTLDIKRAIDSLREELEAVDWYNQRADATKDKNLKGILLHNAKEEKEHAAMLIEWLRQNDEEFHSELKDYVFTDKEDIAHHE
ncbi:MAG: ferritin family protein [Nanoarchaeota archaeon]